MSAAGFGGSQATARAPTGWRAGRALRRASTVCIPVLSTGTALHLRRPRAPARQLGHHHRAGLNGRLATPRQGAGLLGGLPPGGGWLSFLAFTPADGRLQRRTVCGSEAPRARARVDRKIRPAPCRRSRRGARRNPSLPTARLRRASGPAVRLSTGQIFLSTRALRASGRGLRPPPAGGRLGVLRPRRGAAHLARHATQAAPPDARLPAHGARRRIAPASRSPRGPPARAERSGSARCATVVRRWQLRRASVRRENSPAANPPIW